jgi:hypothetical protein
VTAVTLTATLSSNRDNTPNNILIKLIIRLLIYTSIGYSDYKCNNSVSQANVRIFVNIGILCPCYHSRLHPDLLLMP